MALFRDAVTEIASWSGCNAEGMNALEQRMDLGPIGGGSRAPQPLLLQCARAVFRILLAE